MTGYVKCDHCKKLNPYDGWAILHGYECEWCGKHNE